MCELFVKVAWLYNEHLPLYKKEYNGTLTLFLLNFSYFDLQLYFIDKSTKKLDLFSYSECILYYIMLHFVK